MANTWQTGGTIVRWTDMADSWHVFVDVFAEARLLAEQMWLTCGVFLQTETEARLLAEQTGLKCGMFLQTETEARLLAEQTWLTCGMFLQMETKAKLLAEQTWLTPGMFSRWSQRQHFQVDRHGWHQACLVDVDRGKIFKWTDTGHV